MKAEGGNVYFACVQYVRVCASLLNLSCSDAFACICKYTQHTAIQLTEQAFCLQLWEAINKLTALIVCSVSLCPL